MAHYRTTIESPWSPERAYEYLLELGHFADWDPGTKRTRRLDGADGTLPTVGSRYEVVAAAGGREVSLSYEIVEAVAPTSIVLEISSPSLEGVDRIDIGPATGGGSLVTYDAELHLKGWAKIGTPLLALGFRRAAGHAGEGLRRALQAQLR
jgi:Polyketide cyclase / dehydrase and lipid transport